MTAARPRSRRPAPVVQRYDPHWARTPSGRFHRLAHLDPDEHDLAGQVGLFVCWHAGVSPAWVYVGWSTDLAEAIASLAGDERITVHEVNGGLFVTWAHVRSEYCAGMVDHLTRTLRPLIANPAIKNGEEFPIPVRPPGA